MLSHVKGSSSVPKSADQLFFFPRAPAAPCVGDLVSTVRLHHSLSGKDYNQTVTDWKLCLLVLQPLVFAGPVEWPWPKCFDAHVLSTSQSERQDCWVMQNDIRSSASSQVACPLSGVAKIWTSRVRL